LSEELILFRADHGLLPLKSNGLDCFVII